MAIDDEMGKEKGVVTVTIIMAIEMVEETTCGTTNATIQETIEAETATMNVVIVRGRKEIEETTEGEDEIYYY